MKRKSLAKILTLFSLMSFLIMPLSSCSALYEDEGFVITDISWDTNSTNGNTIVKITTSRDENPVITAEIPLVGIKDIKATVSSDQSEMSLTFIYNDPTKSPTTIKIPIVKGKDGRGISDIVVGKDNQGNVTIMFTYTDNTQSNPIVIPSGKDGTNITNIVTDETSDPDKIIITITFSDGSEPKVIEFAKPKDGISIVKIYYDPILSDDKNYAITILYDDGFKETIKFEKPQSTKWYHGENFPEPDLGNDGDYYLNVVSGYVYFKENGKWSFIFSMDGSGSYLEKVVTFHYATDSHWVKPALRDGENHTVIVKYGQYVPLNDFPIISLEGKDFLGWYTSEEYNVNSGQFTDIIPVQKNIDLYARWSK